MNRRQFFVLSGSALAATAFHDLLAAQLPAAAPPQTSFETIRGNVGYFTGRGGTIGWMVNKDAVVVVDTQFPNTAQICVDGLEQRSGDRTIDVVINTHHHGDHTAGNGVFKAASKRIVAHSRVPELMKQAASGQANAPAPVTPTATFDKTWSESLGDETVAATHHGPAHTGGDAVIVFQRANVAHMGDLLFHEIHPRVDRPGGASMQNWIRTLETVTKELSADTHFIAGHARAGQTVLVKRDAVLKFRDYLDAALTHVRKGMAANRPKEEIVALTALPGFEMYQASGTVLTLAGVLTAAYEELSA